MKGVSPFPCFVDSRVFARILTAVALALVGMASAHAEPTHRVLLREAGVAMHSRSILTLILRAGAIQVGTGLLLGLGAALAASRLLQEALYEVKPFDPGVFAAVAVFFAIVSAFACVIPARRASRVDPMVALRAE